MVTEARPALEEGLAAVAVEQMLEYRGDRRLRVVGLDRARGAMRSRIVEETREAMRP